MLPDPVLAREELESTAVGIDTNVGEDIMMGVSSAPLRSTSPEVHYPVCGESDTKQ